MGAGGGMGQGQEMPSPERLKAMADKQAAPLLEQLKSKPNDPALLSQIGNAYYDAQVFPVAIDYYQKSLAINGKDAGVRTDMATALFYSGDIDHAIAEFDHALKDDPKNGNALFNRGIVKWKGKMDVTGAVADWENLLKQDPNYAQADQVRMYVAQAKKHANIKPGQKTDKPAM
jgi:tetratricopeptide (TPR) repeat protein